MVDGVGVGISDESIDLDAARRRGDPALEDALAEMWPDGPPPVRQAAMEIVSGVLGDGEAPAPLRRWFANLANTDPYEADVVARGQAVFRRWSPQIAVALFSASLPWAYAAAHGVEVLARASDLNSGDIRRRIAETGQMLVDVHDLELRHNGSFDQSSQTFRTTTGVRMLHGAVRAGLTADPSWDDRDGLPINQEDLAGTLLTFTVVVFDSLDRLGVRLSPTEREDYLGLWRVIGDLLGIEEQLRPVSVADAEHLRDCIAERQHRWSAAGTRLMAVLLDEMERSMPRGLEKLPRTMVRRLSGPQVADLLEVPRSSLVWTPLVAVLARLGSVLTPRRDVRWLIGPPTRYVAAALFRRYIDEGLAGDRARFRMDAETARRWRIDPAPSTGSLSYRVRTRRYAHRARTLEPVR